MRCIWGKNLGSSVIMRFRLKLALSLRLSVIVGLWDRLQLGLGLRLGLLLG